VLSDFPAPPGLVELGDPVLVRPDDKRPVDGEDESVRPDRPATVSVNVLRTVVFALSAEVNVVVLNLVVVLVSVYMIIDVVSMVVVPQDVEVT